MAIESKENIYVAINIGSSYISGLMATKHASGKVSPIAKNRYKSGSSIQHGCIHNIVDVSNIVSRIIDDLSAHLSEGEIITRVYVGIDCQSMQSKLFKAWLTLANEGEVVNQEHLQELRQQASDAQFPGLEVLRIVDPRYFVDGKRESKPLGVRCHKLEASYQVITVRRNVIDNLREVFVNKLGLEIADILIAPLAEASVTFTNEERTLGCAYINIGGGTSSVSIYNNRLLSALYVLPLGGISITQDLCDLQLLEKDAEQLKLNEGSVNLEIDRNAQLSHPSNPEHSIKQIEVNRYIYARMMEIIGSIINIIAKGNPSDQEPRSLIFSGGVSYTDGLIPLLKQNGGIVRIGVVRRDFVSDDVEERMLREWQTEIGLIYQASQGCITYQAKQLDSLLDNLDEQENSAQPAAHQEGLFPEEQDYTFVDSDEPEDEELVSTQPEQPTLEETSSPNQPKARLGNFFKNFKDLVVRGVSALNGSDEEE